MPSFMSNSASSRHLILRAARWLLLHNSHQTPVYFIQIVVSREASLCYCFGQSPHSGDWAEVITLHSSLHHIGQSHRGLGSPRICLMYLRSESRLSLLWHNAIMAMVNCWRCLARDPSMRISKHGLLPDKVQALLLHADIGVEISVGFHINIGLIHTDIQVNIGANLHLQGRRLVDMCPLISEWLASPPTLATKTMRNPSHLGRIFGSGEETWGWQRWVAKPCGSGCNCDRDRRGKW